MTAARAVLLAALASATCATTPAARPARAQGGPPAAKEAKEAKAKRKEGRTAEDSAAREARHRAGSALFSSDEPLRLTLRADFRDVFRDRDTLERRARPATLTVDAGDGTAPATLRVMLETRGHFRLKPATCAFPPLRVHFDSARTKGTPFAGQRTLKLTTHCRNGNRDSEQNVLREYLVYRIYALFTPRSFRARRARVTYVDARDTAKAVTEPAFFVESERELARRTGGTILEARGGRFSDFDPAQTDLLSVFEYFVGNTDYSLWSLHNVRILTQPGGGYYPVPYDFDWSGAVGAHYAVPDPRLPITNVRQRLYRGPCRSAEELAPVFAQFVARRDTILALYRTLPELEPRYVKDMEGYYAEFYETIADRRRWKDAAERACAEGA
ncbi:MAG: hypothetical protein ACJ79S_18240 [Gemmatimonadaceae bacterium]